MTTVSPTQLKVRLREQIDYIDWSAHGFDAGAHHEANRLAVAVRVLVYDTTHSKSLLSQLSVRDRLEWVDADLVRARTGITGSEHKFGLVIANTHATDWRNAVRAFMPGEIARWGQVVDVQQWWTGAALAANGLQTSREDIVKVLANNDGGAHVEPENRRIRQVIGGLPFRILTGGPEMPEVERLQIEDDFARSVLQHAMRTIAQEVWMVCVGQLDTIDPEQEIPRRVAH